MTRVRTQRYQEIVWKTCRHKDSGMRWVARIRIKMIPPGYQKPSADWPYWTIASELAFFPVACNQYVLAVVKMNQETNFRRQLIVHSSQGCIDVVENIASNHGRFCDLRSSFLDVSILNEVLSTNKNIPNLANFNLWKGSEEQTSPRQMTPKYGLTRQKTHINTIMVYRNDHNEVFEINHQRILK